MPTVSDMIWIEDEDEDEKEKEKEKEKGERETFLAMLSVRMSMQG
jgi:hypothetical protein